MMFNDCEIPHDCECAKRIKPEFGHTQCLVPAINKAADELGWERPYPHAPSLPPR